MKRKGLKTGRKNQTRTRGKRFLIACNGRVTEPEYFREIKKTFEGPRQIDVNDQFASKDPLSFLKKLGRWVKAENKKAREGRFDSYTEVWAVVDADEFDLGPAQQKANEQEITLVISNPCFEVWLIDHSRVCPDSCSTAREAETYAQSIGVTKPTDHKRNNLSKCKSITDDLVPCKVDTALKNAAEHNTSYKQKIRASNLGNTTGYAVWTDVPQIIETLKTA